jgi:hypothetical protein
MDDTSAFIATSAFIGSSNAHRLRQSCAIINTARSC